MDSRGIERMPRCGGNRLKKTPWRWNDRSWLKADMPCLARMSAYERESGIKSRKPNEQAFGLSAFQSPCGIAMSAFATGRMGWISRK
jgi:hypothetical protein